MDRNKEGFWFHDYRPPDVCPECGSSHAGRTSTRPGPDEYDFGRFYYHCNKCGYEEKVRIPWSGGGYLPKSNWWKVTKYPISYYQNRIDLCDWKIESNLKDNKELAKVKSTHLEMINRIRSDDATN